MPWSCKMLTLGEAVWRVLRTLDYLGKSENIQSQNLLVFKKELTVLLPTPHMKTAPPPPPRPLDPNIHIYPPFPIVLFHKVNVPGLPPFPEHTGPPLVSGTLFTLTLFETCPPPGGGFRSFHWPHYASPKDPVPGSPFPWVSHCPHFPTLDLGTFFFCL